MGVGNRLDTLPGINFIGFATRIITTNIRNSWLWPNACGGESLIQHGGKIKVARSYVLAPLNRKFWGLGHHGAGKVHLKALSVIRQRNKIERRL